MHIITSQKTDIFKDKEYTYSFNMYLSIVYGVLALKPADENQLYVNDKNYLGKVFSSL
jgi:hypothetical protein